MSEEIWADDFMDRRPSAEFLTNYILSNDHVKVINVNSPWGSGKSFFLERWARSLSEKHVCVRFNAWETDYTTEPLVALIACIEQQVVDPLALTSTEVGQGIINVGSDLVKKSAPLIVKGLVKKFTGVEIDELLVSGAEQAVDDVVGALLKEQAATEENVHAFKAAVVERLSNAAENRRLAAPAFIFIDELDRCRPTYAIELLERIKHFFELKDCRFVIASDSEQLAHSIRAVYGQGFASEKYLNRFFDAEFVLNNEDVFAFVHTLLPEINSHRLGVNISGDVDRMWNRRGDGIDPVYPRAGTIVTDIKGFQENALIIVGLTRFFNVALREVVNYVKQIKSAADTIGGKVDFFWLAFLVFFKNTKTDQYSLIFDRANGRAVLDKYLDSMPLSVNFSFTYSLESVKDISSFYLLLTFSDVPALRKLSENLKGWKSEVFYANCNDWSRLINYRRVVELAHRLS